MESIKRIDKQIEELKKLRSKALEIERNSKHGTILAIANENYGNAAETICKEILLFNEEQYDTVRKFLNYVDYLDNALKEV
jgi:hypothetical protein